MEWDELQATWNRMSEELEAQKKLTNSIVMEMARTKYKNKFNKISHYEKLGTVVCFGAALGIILNFSALDTWYLKLCGILSLGFLIIMPILVLAALKQIQELDIFNQTYSEILRRYTKSKTRLLRLQQISITLSFAMLFLIVPITAKIFNDQDIFSMSFKPSQWIGFVLVFVGMLFFSRWGYKSYQRITASAALLLEDLK
ncbi:hypothetical protein ACFQZJ_09205 [Maribacter chungangensis]|uniref:Uncharacterized protein n=1 Tax=Maribacter chungangensis TaxID=1069117 RepID=A0ABW3B3K3_9FLAO